MIGYDLQSSYFRLMNKHGFATAFAFWRRSFSFVSHHKLSHFYIYPLVFSIILFLFSISLSSDLVNYLMSLVYERTGLPSASSQFNWELVADSILRFILWFFSLLLMWKIGKYINLICMSPILSLLSARVQSILSGSDEPFSMAQLLKDMIRGIAISSRNLFLELLFLVVIAFLNVVLAIIFPFADFIFSPLSIVLSFLISCYYTGSAICDYALENKRFSYHQTIDFFSNHKSMAIGFGLIYSLLFKIPFIGFSLAIVSCTVGSTLMLNQGEKSHRINE